MRRARRPPAPTPLHQLAVDLPALVRALPGDVDGGAERALVDRLPDLLARVDRADLVRAVPAYAKVAYHHLEHGSIDDLRRALTADLLQNRQHDASVLDVGPATGEPVVHLPGWGSRSIPPETFVLADRETTFVGATLRVRVEADRIVGVVRAGLAHIDTDQSPSIEVHTDGVDLITSEETSGHRAEASDPAHWRETLDRSTWVLDAPVALATDGVLRVDLTVSLAGRTARGQIDVVLPVDPGLPAIETIELTGGGIVVTGTGLGRVVLQSAAATVEPDEQTAERVVFPARLDRSGRGLLPLPIGDYRLESAGVAVPLAPNLSGWPTELVDGPLRGHTTPDGLRLVKPRRDDENTMYGQRALRAAYRAADVTVGANAALFQCYWAEVATDSQVAIHHELRRRQTEGDGPEMSLYWGVVDHAVALPAGGIAVVAGTREWYDVLATARYLVKNTEVGAYTRLRPGQIYLQTFHGQPFKQMGRGEFDRRMPAWRAEHEASDRRSAFWDAICLPYPEAADFYRDAYDWTGPAFDHGLPRTDGLVAGDVEDRRRVAREVLGIRPGQIAVLHATTWREDLSRGSNTSTDPGLLDVEALADALGDGFVVLQRSHHSVARSDARVGGGRGVIDVTDHPEVNDLILAADLAILDYSSLRFDFAITGRPMIFFVPDLADYETRLRGFLFGFAESAPGPLVSDARQLPDLVRDTAWTAEHADAYAAFNHRFNQFHDGHAAERVVDGLLEWRGPRLSIVVPVYQVREWLDACLQSLRDQHLTDVEIVVVDDGSTDGSGEIARRHAKADPRVRVVDRANGGLSAARNTGVAASRAPYLTFVDSDDLVLPAGFARAVGALDESGSDVALLPYCQLTSSPQAVPPWVASLYGETDVTVVAHDHPEVLAQATAWSKVYRRSFWDAAGLSFTEGILYEDQDVTARAFVAADRIDLVPEPTYLWRIRPGSITREATERSIGAFFDAAAVSLDVLAPVRGARAARASQLLTYDVPRYLRTLRKITDEGYRTRLLAAAADLLAEPDIDLSAAPAEARVAYALVSAGRASEVESLVRQGGFDLATLASDEVDGQPALLFPFSDDPDVPPVSRVLSVAQTPLDAWVMRARIDDGQAQLTVLAYLRHVDGPPDAARAWWIDAGGARLSELTVIPAPELVGHRWRTTREGNERASWTVTGPVPDLEAVGRVRLELQVTHHGRTASGMVDGVDPAGSAAAFGPSFSLPVEEVQATGSAATDVDPSGRVRVDATWIELPTAEGAHVVADAVAGPLLPRLPLDLDTGWLGLDEQRRLVWTRLPDGPREQLTVWFARDHR